MSLIDAERAYGGADGSQERNEKIVSNDIFYVNFFFNVPSYLTDQMKRRMFTRERKWIFT